MRFGGAARAYDEIEPLEAGEMPGQALPENTGSADQQDTPGRHDASGRLKRWRWPGSGISQEDF
jgi:hypothetical protein